MPLTNFIEFYLNGDTSALAIDESAEPNEVEQASTEIRQYFEDAMTDKDKILQAAPLEADNQTINLSRVIVGLIRDLYEKGYDYPIMYEPLRRLNLNYPLDKWDADQIDVVENEITSKEIRLRQRGNEFSNHANSGDPINEEWFYTTCMRFADMHNGGAIYSPTQFTLLQFVLKYKEYTEWCKRMNQLAEQKNK